MVWLRAARTVLRAVGLPVLLVLLAEAGKVPAGGGVGAGP